MTRQNTYCPSCKAQTHIQKTENLLGEPIEAISCEICGSVYTRRNGTVWTLIISSKNAWGKQNQSSAAYGVNNIGST